MDVSAETMTNVGRVDATLEAGNNIYIIECKIDKNAKEALDQINDKKYAEQYYLKVENGYKVYKIGMNFSSKERNIEDVVVE